MNSAARGGRLILVLFASALVLAVSMAPRSMAHEQKTALTDIFYNERSGNLEIAHRISLHDAEHALHEVSDLKADLAQSSEAQKAFAKYVADRFTLSFKGKAALKLRLLGQELERGYLWVYQEIKLPDPIGTSFIIGNTILQDVVKGQVNTVNVRYGSQVATFEFEEKTGRQHYPGPVVAERKNRHAEERKAER